MSPLLSETTEPAGAALADALRLEQLKVSLLAGAAADTNIAVTGIEVGDRIVSVIHNTAGTLVDLTSEGVVLTDGNLQLTDTDTTGDQLLVIWVDVT